jgi:hypothetical protein
MDRAERGAAGIFIQLILTSLKVDQVVGNEEKRNEEDAEGR